MNTDKTPKPDITPGEDKFLRLHIEDLSEPIRRSIYAPPVNRRSDGVVSSLLIALLIFAATAVIIWLTQ